MGKKEKLTTICSRHRVPSSLRATIREPYIPFIPKRWNGVLVLAEAQNHGKNSKAYLSWLRSLAPVKRIQRLYLRTGKVGVHPWDDGSLKLAVEAALSLKAEETAISNASLWSQVHSNGKNQNPSKELADRSIPVWKAMLKVLRPRLIVTAGSIAKDTIRQAGGKPLAWRLPAPMSMSRASGLFSENDLLRRYPEVAKVVKARPEWLATGYRRNKIFFACHAVSVSDKSCG